MSQRALTPEEQARSRMIPRLNPGPRFGEFANPGSGVPVGSRGGVPSGGGAPSGPSAPQPQIGKGLGRPDLMTFNPQGDSGYNNLPEDFPSLSGVQGGSGWGVSKPNANLNQALFRYQRQNSESPYASQSLMAQALGAQAPRPNIDPGRIPSSLPRGGSSGQPQRLSPGVYRMPDGSITRSPTRPDNGQRKLLSDLERFPRAR